MEFHFFLPFWLCTPYFNHGIDDQKTHNILAAPVHQCWTVAVALAPPRQHIRTVGFGAETRSMYSGANATATVH
eukprot:scaffold30528_cov61-Cyclotella_meneghiniana.AAC.2